MPSYSLVIKQCGKISVSAAVAGAISLSAAGAIPISGSHMLHAFRARPLLQHVYIISKTGKNIKPNDIMDLRQSDGRWNLSQGESQLGLKLSKEQADQLMACVGKITCRTLHGKNQGTAVSVLRPDILVTARHAFIQRDGKSEALPTRCTFHNYSDQRTEIPVMVSRDQAKPGPYFNNFDYAVVRLKAPLKGCNSFAVDNPEALLNPGDQFVSVTIRQSGVLNRTTGTEPVIAKGEVKQVFEGAFDGPSIYWTDVDLGAGGSGGGIFVLDPKGNLQVEKNGRLVMKAMAIATGSGGKNGEPYKGKLDRGNQSILVGVDSTFLKAILRAGDELGTQTHTDAEAPTPVRAQTASTRRPHRRSHQHHFENSSLPFTP